MPYLRDVLYNFIVDFRWVGMLAMVIIAMAVLISEGAKEKLSPGKLLTVTASAILATVLFWSLPTIIEYARSDAEVIAPVPAGGMYQ